MDKKPNESKYFYIVVLITLALGGVIVWQLFFADDMFQVFDDPGYEEVPELDFVFFDSYTFQDLSEFRRGDDPLLPWRQVRNQNPFQSPQIPRDRSLREWWAIFNIQLNDWRGVYPSMIEGEVSPNLILFEGRWYELVLKDFDELDGFVIANEEGESLIQFSEEKISEEVIRFQASSTMAAYGNGEIQGDIEVIEDGEYEVLRTEDDDYEQSGMDLLMAAGSDLSAFYEEVRELEDDLEEDEINEMERVYSELENEFQSLEEIVLEGGVDEGVLEQEINNFRAKISNASQNLNEEDEEEIEEEIIVEDEEGGDDTDEAEYEEVEEATSQQVEASLDELRNELSQFEEDIERMEDEEEIEEALAVYQELITDLENVEDRYYNQEVSEEILIEEIRELYDKGDQLTSELSYYQ